MRRKIIIVSAVVMVVIGVIALEYGLFSRESSLEDPNYEAIATVDEILDGDTLKVEVTKILDPHMGVSLGKDKIRLTGIDTEETQQDKAVRKYEDVRNLSQEQYEKTIYYQYAIATKNCLKNNIPKGTRIYIDIDDLADGKTSYRGYYGRLIALIYVRESGKWININARLLNHACSFEDNKVKSPVLTKFSSEFNPYEWLEKDYPYA